MQNNTLLRSLPKVDKFIEHQDFQKLSKTVLLPILRDALETLRNDILADKVSEVNSDDIRQNILEQYNTLNSELNKYLNIFQSKPRLLVLTKSDLEPEVKLPEISGFQESDVIAISAVSGYGLDQLLDKIVKILESHE